MPPFFPLLPFAGIGWCFLYRKFFRSLFLGTLAIWYYLKPIVVECMARATQETGTPPADIRYLYINSKRERMQCNTTDPIRDYNSVL